MISALITNIYINAHVDLTITTKKLTELFATMEDKKLHVESLGFWLSLPEIKTDEIVPPRGEKRTLTSMPLTIQSLLGAGLLGHSVGVVFTVRLI